MFERQYSSDLISMNDVLVRERSFQSFSEETFQNVPPTFNSLGARNSISGSVEETFQNVPPAYNSFGARNSISGSIDTTTSSEALLVGIKKAARPNIKKICVVTLVVANICTIIALIVALAIVSSGKDNKNENNCQNNGRTTGLPLSVPQERLSTDITTPKVDTDTTKTTDETGTITVTPTDTSTSSAPPATSISPIGTWLMWGSWTECSATCGNGIHIRYRECNKIDGINTDCQGNYVQVEGCTENECPEYGKWTTWSSWASCDVTCNAGHQSRTRSCLKTNAAVLECVGDSLQQQQCAQWDCPDCSTVCSEGYLSPTCEMCICNTTKEGVVVTRDNDTISDATVYIDGSPSTVIANSETYGIFSTSTVCDGTLINVEKTGYLSSDCQSSSAGIICTVIKNDKPIFNAHPQPKARVVGENVTLCCSAEGIPDIKYYEWMKGSLLVDNSFYLDEKTLELTDVTKSDSGVYKCRANSDAGSVMSKEANIIIKDTEGDFCEDALGQRQIHLPEDCVQPETVTASVQTGFCNRQLCRKDGVYAFGTCREESQNCCTVSDFELSTIRCSGYNLSVLSVKTCGCGDCSFNVVRVVGTVLFYGINEYVRYGQVYVNGEFNTYTNSEGYFKVSINEEHGSAVITIISGYQKTTKVIDISEVTTGTIYTNMYIVPETCGFQINPDEENIVNVGNCGKEINPFITVAEIHIEPFSFIDDYLNVFHGIVNVSLTVLNATNISDLDMMPGLLFSINDEGENAHITSLAAFYIRFYDSVTHADLKLGKNVNIDSTESEPEEGLTVYELKLATGLWQEISGEFPARLGEPDVESWINIGKQVHVLNECFYNIRIYEDPNLLSEITNSKYQVFIQTVHIDGSQSYETYGHTFSPSRTCFRTICDDHRGFIEVWISNFESETAEYLMPANPKDNVTIGLSFAQKHNILYTVVEDDPHLSLKFKVSSDGPFFDNLFTCLSSTELANHFKFYFKDSVEDIFTLRHFFDLSTQNTSMLQTINRRVWYPNRQEGHRICYVKVKIEIQIVENIRIRAFSYGGTNINISNEILGIRQTDTSTTATKCLEYKCSGPINEEFSENDFDNTKVTIEHLSSGSARCAVQSFSQDLIDNFPGLNPLNAGENKFTFYAPNFYSPSFGIYSASTSSDDIESARSTAKKECRSGIPMDVSSDNPDIGTAVVFTCG